MIWIPVLEVVFESQPTILTKIFHYCRKLLEAEAGFFPHFSKFFRAAAGKVDLA
jgi:hypothetical protein